MRDLLSTALSSIKTASLSKQKMARVPNNKLVMACLQKIYKLGYISSFTAINKNCVIVCLRYANAEPLFNNIVRVSKPGRRVFHTVKQLKKAPQNHGFAIYSTSRGILTDPECIYYNTGGELLFSIF